MSRDSAGDWQPTASLEVLRQRSRLLQVVRAFFLTRGYWEVETPLLSRETCIDRWIDPIEVDVGGERCFLQTSPEFAMKRLLAAGADAIFQITRSFRGGEVGPRHNPEFTLVEWYRTGTTDADQMQVVEDLIRRVGDVAGPSAGALGEEPFPRYTYDEAFERATGERVLDLDVDGLAELARRHGIRVPGDPQQLDLDEWRNVLLAECVEPWLAQFPAVFLTDYPSSQAALAALRENDAHVAGRFELYLSGCELCNGYDELTDASELRRRMRLANEQRIANGLRSLPVESRLLAAMESGLPACSGVALGFDRLVMWALSCTQLADVWAFPFPRA